MKTRFFQRVTAFLADGDGRNFLAFPGAKEILSFAQNIGVESAGQPALSRQDDGQNSLFRPVGQQRVLGLVDAGHDGTQHARELSGVRPRREPIDRPIRQPVLIAVGADHHDLRGIGQRRRSRRGLHGPDVRPIGDLHGPCAADCGGRVSLVRIPLRSLLLSAVTCAAKHLAQKQKLSKRRTCAGRDGTRD